MSDDPKTAKTWHGFAWKDKANEKTDQVMKKKKEGYVLEVGV